MPDWMRDPEEKLENLNQNLLEEESSTKMERRMIQIYPRKNFHHGVALLILSKRMEELMMNLKKMKIE